METENKPIPADQAPVEEPQKKKKKEKKKKTLKQELVSWALTLAAALILASLVRAFVVEPIRVDGDSMNNTLMNNEVVLVSKLDYLTGEIQRGDVVICRYPGRLESTVNLGAALAFDTHTLFVKRVVALPGDTLAILDGVLYVNGEPVPNPELMASEPQDFAPVLLGDDQYFVMGDNRFTSHDSRARDVGPISRDAIMGKVRYVILPFSNMREVN